MMTIQQKVQQKERKEPHYLSSEEVIQMIKDYQEGIDIKQICKKYNSSEG
jgi:hypothetical protein